MMRTDTLLTVNLTPHAWGLVLGALGVADDEGKFDEYETIYKLITQQLDMQAEPPIYSIFQEA